MKVLGLIPARLGSTGVKRKNIRDLAGKPLIEYTLEAAKASRLDRVVLTTEAEEIARHGRRVGVEVPFLRPAEFAANDSKAIDVVTHALDFFEREEGYVPDAVMYLQPTSPFRRSEHIDGAITLMEKSDKNSVLGFSAPPNHPAYMFIREEERGFTDLMDPTVYRKERRQDMVPVYAANSSIILSRTSYLKRTRQGSGLLEDFDSFEPLEVDFPVTIDINTEGDFLFADFVMRQSKENAS